MVCWQGTAARKKAAYLFPGSMIISCILYQHDNAFIQSVPISGRGEITVVFLPGTVAITNFLYPQGNNSVLDLSNHERGEIVVVCRCMGSWILPTGFVDR